MHSKWKIWDFFKARPEVLTAPGGIIAFSCFDQLAFKLIKDRFPNKDAFYEGKITVLLGREVSSDWFDDNFLSLGLFGNQESYLIHFAEELSPEVKEKIVTSKELLLDGRYLFLNFSKEDAFFKKILKVEEIETIQIQAPAFWEESELLDFLCEEYQVYLSYSAKEKIKEKVPFDINNYSDTFNDWIGSSAVTSGDYIWKDGQKRNHQVHVEVDTEEVGTYKLRLPALPTAALLVLLYAARKQAVKAKTCCVCCPKGAVTCVTPAAKVIAWETLAVLTGLIPAWDFDASGFVMVMFPICWVTEINHNRLLGVITWQEHEGQDYGVMGQTTYPRIESSSQVDFRGNGKIYPPDPHFDVTIIKTDELAGE